jgi:hypothetical protein
MQSKQNVLIVTALILGAIYLYSFTDWLRPSPIQIIAQTRPFRPAASTARVYPVTFVFDGLYTLTSIKVTPLNALATNKFALPVWDLVASTNAKPTKGFLYGGAIPGMKPRQTNSSPQPLQPNTAYRLLVQAGRSKGQVDFHTSGELEPSN